MVIDQVHSSFEEPNSFVGRERELNELRHFARSMRALTLCGSGGIGKTRLALQALAGLAEDFPERGWFCEAGDPRGPRPVCPRVAPVLERAGEPGRTPR